MTNLKTRVSKVDNRLVHELNGETMVIEPWGRDGLRVRVTAGPAILDTPWALTEPVDTTAVIEISDTEAEIRNGKISARIQDIRTQKGHLQFFKHSGGRKTCILAKRTMSSMPTTLARAFSSRQTTVSPTPKCISPRAMANASTAWG